MLSWKKVGRRVYSNGSTTTIYCARGKSQEYIIESRKQSISHANRSGFWFYTSFILIVGNAEQEYRRLQDAKAAAEQMESQHHILTG